MKILHLGKYYPPYNGGIETFLYDLNEELYKQKDLQSDVLCFDESSRNSDDYSRGYKIHRSSKDLSLANMPMSIDYMVWLKKNIHTYDVIHLHYPNPFADLSLFLSGYKGKLVIHWHSDVIKSKVLQFVYYPLMTWLLRKADKIITTSPNYANNSCALSKFKNKIQIIPLGFNPKRFLSSDDDKVQDIKNTYSGKKIIFSLGRHVPYKGFKYLIEAAKYLSDKYVILIGGTGLLYEQNKEMIEKFHLEDKVKLIGFISDDDISNYYKACDTYVLSSISKAEAFGMVQIEAMSFGKPVISTDIEGSGVPWVNRHQETGLIVPTCNSVAIAKAINIIFEDEKTLCQLGQEAKLRFEENFTIEKIANQVSDIYSQYPVKESRQRKQTLVIRERTTRHFPERSFNFRISEFPIVSYFKALF